MACGIEGGVATLQLGLSGGTTTATMVWELADALERIASDPSVRALLLTADPRHGFPSAFDPDSLAIALDQPLDRQPPNLLSGLRIPTVAALFGAIRNPSLELALACDLRVAADDAEFAFTYMRDGLLPVWGGTQRLPRIAGLSRAQHMILLGEAITAQEALACGLVTRLLPSAQVLDGAREIAGAWLRGAPWALAYGKEAVQRGADLPLEHALRLEWDLAVLLETTRDRAEGISAFLEKREPRFSGE